MFQFGMPEDLFDFPYRLALFEAEGPMMSGGLMSAGIVAYRSALSHVETYMPIGTAVFEFDCFPDQNSSDSGFSDFPPPRFSEVLNRPGYRGMAVGD